MRRKRAAHSRWNRVDESGQINTNSRLAGEYEILPDSIMKEDERKKEYMLLMVLPASCWQLWLPSKNDVGLQLVGDGCLTGWWRICSGGRAF